MSINNYSFFFFKQSTIYHHFKLVDKTFKVKESEEVELPRCAVRVVPFHKRDTLHGCIQGLRRRQGAPPVGYHGHELTQAGTSVAPAKIGIVERRGRLLPVLGGRKHPGVSLWPDRVGSRWVQWTCTCGPSSHTFPPTFRGGPLGSRMGGAPRSGLSVRSAWQAHAPSG